MSTQDPGMPPMDSGVEGDSSPQTERLRAEVEQTRAELSETIDAIQDRLNPRNVVARAAESVRDATVGRMKTMMDSASGSASGVAAEARERAGDVMHAARENQWPLALIGAGAAWWLLKRRQSSYPEGRAYRDYRAYDVPGQYGEPYGVAYREGSYAAGEYGRNTWDKVSDTISAKPMLTAAALAGLGWWAASSMGSRTGNGPSYGAGYSEFDDESKIEQAKASISDAAARTQEKASELASNVQHRASELANRARFATSRVGSRSQQAINENPLAMAALAAAAGLVVGFATPGTQVENEYLGEARDSVVSSVQDAASNVVERAQDVAKDAVNKLGDLSGGHGSVRA